MSCVRAACVQTFNEEFTLTPIDMSSTRLRLTVWDHNKLWNNRFLGRAHVDLSGLRQLPHAEEKLTLHDLIVKGKVTETAGEGSTISFTVLSATVVATAEDDSERGLPEVVLSPAEKTLYDAQALKWFQHHLQPADQSRALNNHLIVSLVHQSARRQTT